jgi:hypothetical protein
MARIDNPHVVMVPVSQEMLHDAPSLSDFNSMFDTFFVPWRLADRNPFPDVVLFPCVARWQHNLIEARHRLAYAIDVLRYGTPEPDDDW